MARDKAGQIGATLDNYDYMPATVVGHTEHADGMTLHTLDPREETDIEVYNDERPAHRTGNPPEEN